MTHGVKAGEELNYSLMTRVRKSYVLQRMVKHQRPNDYYPNHEGCELGGVAIYIGGVLSTSCVTQQTEKMVKTVGRLPRPSSPRWLRVWMGTAQTEV